MTFVVLLFVFALSSAHAAPCGALIQTSWRINARRKLMTYANEFKHPGRKYCVKTSAAGMNARVELLDHKRTVRIAQPVFIPWVTHYDFKAARGGQMIGRAVASQTVNVPIHFPDGPDFRAAKYIVIRAPGLPQIGPTRFK